jgi:deoxyribonuclease-4
MRRLGVHTSIAGGMHLSLERAHVLGCTTVQIFSHNPRGWAVKQILEEEAEKFQLLRRKYNISPVYIHTSYLINMASWDKRLRRQSIDLLVIEMDRADILGTDFVILHTGSASGRDSVLSRKRAIDALYEVSQRGKWRARLLIENTAGERGDIASDIVSLSEILDSIADTFISGICIDTCHAFAAGYHISEDEGIQRFSRDIKKYIGLNNVKLIHLNDSKGDIGAGIDRHEHIGLGKIGKKGLKRFIQFSSFKNIPLILETPKKRESDDVRNLKIVRKMIKEK